MRVAWNKGLSKESDIRVAKYARKRPPRTEEHKKKLGDAWRGKKRPKSFSEKMSQWMKDNPNSGQFKKGQKPANTGVRSGKYTVSKWHPDYEEAKAKKKGRCDICGVSENDTSRKLSFDHCHTTGRFRGWLCGKCNTALGLVSDKTEVLYKMIDYLNEKR